VTHRPRLARLLRPAAAILSGLLLALCYPPWDIGELVWVWAIPLLVALWSLPEMAPANVGKPKDSARPGRWARIRRRIASQTRAIRGFRLGFLAGAVFFAINLHWIFELRHVVGSVFPGILGVAALAGFLGLYVGAFGAFAATVGRPTAAQLSISDGKSIKPSHEDSDSTSRARLEKITDGGKKKANLFTTSVNSLRLALLNACAWVGLEWLRGWVLTGFSWNGLGVAMHSNPTLVQVCDIVGVTGLAFLPIFLLCILLNTAWRVQLEAGSRSLRPHLDFMLAMVLVILVFFYGVRKASAPVPGDVLELRALAIQPNIPQSLKWQDSASTEIYQTLNDLTRIHVETQPFDLVIWPEAATPLYLDHPGHDPFFESLLGTGDHALLLGSNSFLPRGELVSNSSIKAMYNTAALLTSPDPAEAQLHHKIHLVPFGEFLPLRKAFPPFDWIFGALLPSDFDKGESTDPLTLPVASSPGETVLISPLICFEDTVGRLVRRAVRPGPQVFVNLTNDGWFGESAASEQHMINASFRCIELRRPMIRCANTGVTCFIDRTGSLYDRHAGDGFPRQVEDPETGSTFIRGTLPGTVKIERNPPMTVFARFGDAFSILCLVVALIASAFYRIRLGRA